VPTEYDGALHSGVRRHPREVVLGIDVGTGSLKGGIFALDGTPLGEAQVDYALTSPEPDAMEQDPLDWWTALATVSHRLMAQVDGGAHLLALSIGGQAPTLVAADADFLPTHPGITWLDQRPAAEADRLYARLGEPVPVWGSWPAQAAWFVHNRPAAMRTTRWFFGCPDYLVSRLTRTPVSMQSIAAPEIEAAELDTRLIPEPWVPGELVGRVDAETADFTGLPAGTPVVAGFIDGILGVLGSGVRQPGDACMNSGTSGTFSLLSLPPLGYPIFGLNIMGSAMNTSGKALDWFLESIARRGASYAELLDEAAGAPPGSDGLLFLPHLAGERAPVRDPRSRAAWVGLTLGHDRRHLVRAVLEGVAFGFRAIQDSLEAEGGAVRDVRVVGGQAHSPLWNQIKADILNRPVLVPQAIEASVVGAALLAALGVGAYWNLEVAVDAMVRVSHTFEPDPRRVALYQRMFESYRELQPVLRATNWRLHDLSSAMACPSESLAGGQE
jgi:xylulokinase